MQSNKHVIGRYQVLLKILQAFEIEERDLLRNCVVFALKGIQHNLQDVRTLAYRCMSELYRLIGPSIRKELDGLRPA